MDDVIKKNRRSANKTEWRNIKTQTTLVRDAINPDASAHSKEAHAEEAIICYLLHRKQECEDIAAKAPPDIFITEFNRRVYSAILEKLKVSENFTLSMLAEEFSAEELGRISGIEAKNRETLLTPSGFEDCVAYLDGETAKIVVRTDGLDKAQAASIKDIILDETEVLAENIRIFEVK